MCLKLSPLLLQRGCSLGLVLKGCSQGKLGCWRKSPLQSHWDHLGRRDCTRPLGCWAPTPDPQKGCKRVLPRSRVFLGSLKARRTGYWRLSLLLDPRGQVEDLPWSQVDAGFVLLTEIFNRMMTCLNSSKYLQPDHR